MAEVSTFNESVTGTSANSYPSTAQYENIRVGMMNDKSLLVENTDGSNSIDYKVTVYHNVDSSGFDYPLDASGNTEKTLTNGTYALINMPEDFYKVDVFVKSTTTDNHGTFEISMTGSSK